MSEEHKFESFSVGVKPETNNVRRELMDAVAILAGRESRLMNHTFCMERLMFGLHSLMLDAPDSFAVIFGDGEALHKSRFFAWLKDRGA